MKADKNKLEIMMAKRAATPDSLSLETGLARTTIYNTIQRRNNTRPLTMGLLAKALRCEVEEIILEEQG